VTGATTAIRDADLALVRVVKALTAAEKDLARSIPRHMPSTPVEARRPESVSAVQVDLPR
jgi:hypothetical protein